MIRGHEKPPRVADSPQGSLVGVAVVPLHERHDGDAGFEPGQTQCELREQDRGGEQHSQRAAVCVQERQLPRRNELGVSQDVEETDA
jgi:hypothetical protein